MTLLRVGRRTLLTALGWSIGGYLLGGPLAVLIGGGVRGFGASGAVMDPGWAPFAAAGGALFALVAAALRAFGARGSASRRVLAIVGAASLGAVVLISDRYVTGEFLGVVELAPHLVGAALALGGLLGWATLAIGGARE